MSALNGSEERLSRTQIRKPRNAGNSGVWRYSFVLSASAAHANRMAILSPEANASRSDTGSFQAWCRSIFRAFPSVFPIDIQSVPPCCGIAVVVVFCNADCCRPVCPAGPFRRSVVLRLCFSFHCLLVLFIGTLSFRPQKTNFFHLPLAKRKEV